ncbi:putative Ig domain-containing protein [Pseudomonadota bacterium]
MTVIQDWKYNDNSQEKITGYITEKSSPKSYSLAFFFIAFMAIIFIPASVYAESTRIFGPQNFDRGSGQSAPVISQFLAPNTAYPYTINIYNGGLQDDDELGEFVSSSEIILNGEAVAKPHNFNQNIDFVSVVVSLLSSNELSVELRGKPGGRLAVEIVPEGNHPPIAAAGSDQVLYVGDTAALNGSESSDVNGDPLTYQWSIISRPALSQATLSDANAVNPKFQIDEAGTYEFQLIVSDGQLTSPPDTFVITTLNSKPVADAGTDITVFIGDVATLGGQGSYDIDRDVLTYSWSLLEAPVGSAASLSDPTTVQPTFMPDLVGLYSVQLVVNDGEYNSLSDSVQIIVPNRAPLITSPGAQNNAEGNSVILSINASDADDHVLSYSANGLPMGLAIDPQTGVILGGLGYEAAGNYTVNLLVSDGIDSSAVSFDWTVTNTNTNREPSIISPGIQMRAEGDSINLGIVASDPDNDVLTYSATALPTGLVINTATGIISGTLSYTASGVHISQVAVSDGLANASVDFVWNITETNRLPIITSAPVTEATVGQPYLYTVQANDDDGDTLAYSLTASPVGMTIDVTSGAISWLSTIAGDHSATVQVVDEQGGQAVQHFNVIIEEDLSILPPDPADIAPQLNLTEFTIFANANEFLYTGSDPIQTGVAEGTIEPQRVAVIRGRALNQDGEPLPGVSIAIKDHPEFGQTLSRLDGAFDMAVNGGTLLSINYTKPGYLPLQRQVDVIWNGYAYSEDVVLIQLDPKVTAIDLTDTSQAFQVAQGSLSDDMDGQRQATLLFPQGTTATMTLPNGTTQPLSTLNVRATEYTVGEFGPQRMQGPLPSASGYTYAVELSVDEVLQNGIKQNGIDVKFNQVVPFYVDNFLDFPVGEPVPVGYYDADKSAWVPYDNGRIIKILTIIDGKAELDIDGSDTPADASQLAELGITEAEQQKLATVYEVGKSLWRVALTHLSTWDCNWPYDVPNDSTAPPDEAPKMLDTGTPKDPCEKKGCVIKAESQVLGEDFSITGVPHGLHYRSDRAKGRKTGNSISIPLSGDSVPASLKRIDLTVSIAGQVINKTFQPLANQAYTFVWDGKDAYGRDRNGRYTAVIDIGYVYDAVYVGGQGQGAIRAFGLAGRVSENGSDLVQIGIRRVTGQTVVINSIWQAELAMPFKSISAGLGGLSISAHHAYDTRFKLLHKGNGDSRAVEGTAATISTIAGTGAGTRFTGNGLKATDVSFDGPEGVLADHKGGFYIATHYSVLYVSSAGIINEVAGGYTAGCPAYGVPATETRLYTPSGLALGPDGALYISDRSCDVIVKIDQNGILHKVAGGNYQGFSGDGGLATEAQLNAPYNIDIGPDSSIYIADAGNYRIRRISPDGVITTIAGTGDSGFSGDGGPATEAQLGGPFDLAIATDGSLYFTDRNNRRVRRIDNNGFIRTIAGSGLIDGAIGDGDLAINARFIDPKGIAINSDGGYFIVDGYERTVRYVGTNGIITTVAGNGSVGSDGDGGLALAASFDSPYGIDSVPGDGLYISDLYGGRIRKVGTYSKFDMEDVLISSEDGRELYHFTASGRHFKTLNAITGEIIYAFNYDINGYLTSITDIDNDITTIERLGDGIPLAIVSADGQRIIIGLDENGYLNALTNEKGEIHQMQYTADGLLTQYTDPRGQISHYAYNDLGRFIQVEEPNGGGWILDRTTAEDGFSVTMTSGEGRATVYYAQTQTTGDYLRAVTSPDGTIASHFKKTNGEEISISPDGTVATQKLGPDPRFGMLSPIIENASIELPSGLISNAIQTRSVTLTDESDSSSLTELIDTMIVNGRTSTKHYDLAMQTWTNTSPEGRISSVQVNLKGRPVQRQITGLNDVSYSYDTRGRIDSITEGSGADARTTIYAYYNYSSTVDGALKGYLETVTDPAGRVVKYNYDQVGHVVRETLPDLREIAYGYDENSNLISLTPPSRPVHAFTYNAADQEEDYTPPVVAGITNPVTHYDYNLDKQLTKITRPDGQVIDYIYDQTKGRLNSMSVPHGNYSYGYDPVSGQLTSVTAPGGEVLSYSYDGSLPTTESWSGSISGNIERVYDNDFRLDQLKLNGSLLVDYGYDDDGILTQANAMSLLPDSDNGLLISTTLGDVATSRTYNDFGELATYSASYNGNGLYQTTLDTTLNPRDKLGRILHKSETVGSETHEYDYEYDQAGRLWKMWEDGVLTTTYTYDDNGNRTHVNGQLVGVYDDQDRLVSYAGATYTYSSNGELKSKVESGVTTSYQYDVLGNLRQAALPGDVTVEYIVDGQNRRVGKKVNGALAQGFLYQDQLNPIAELDGSNSIVARFIYADKNHVPSYMEKDGKIYRIISDHLGSPRLIIDIANGSIAQRMDYNAWGDVTFDTNPGFQPFGFAGGIYDLHTGLVQFGARDYDADVGRWTAKDPIRFSGDTPNLYGYVFGDPVNFIDPTGKIGLPGAAIGGTIGGVSSFMGALSTGASLGDAAVAGGMGALSGAYTGFLGGTGIIGSGVLGGLSNLAGQLIGNNLDKDPCNNTNINWGGVIGSAVGGGWAAGITRGAGPISGAMAGWKPATASGAVGTALGE